MRIETFADDDHAIPTSIDDESRTLVEEEFRVFAACLLCEKFMHPPQARQVGRSFKHRRVNVSGSALLFDISSYHCKTDATGWKTAETSLDTLHVSEKQKV